MKAVSVILRLRRKLAEAEGALRAVEWKGQRVQYADGGRLVPTCPACGWSQEDGHAPDCLVAGVLGTEGKASG